MHWASVRFFLSNIKCKTLDVNSCQLSYENKLQMDCGLVCIAILNVNKMSNINLIAKKQPNTLSDLS